MIICKNIIRQNGYNINDCFFILNRSVVLDDGLFQAPQWMNKFIRSQNILHKIVFYILHKRSIDAFINNSTFELYYPFSYKYPQHNLVKVHFIEEGFSSCAEKRAIPSSNADKNVSCTSEVKDLLTNFLLSSFNDRVKSLFVGFLLTEDTPKYKTEFYTLSNQAYKYINNNLISKIVLTNEIKPAITYNIEANSFILILDRFSKGGRPYSLDNYLNCIEQEINWLLNHNVSKSFVKFHPVDENTNLKTIFYDYTKRFSIVFEEFDGNLEYLALQNVGLHFVGTNSTILYYAPFLGDKNRSVSFSRYLASIDNDYLKFLDSFGGIDNFVNIFSSHVLCL